MTFLAALCLLAVQAPPPPYPGLDAPIAFTLEGGLFGASLDAVEAQTGLSISLVAAVLPAGLTIPKMSHRGTVTEGMDKLFRPLGLRWEIGELGGIVVLPKELKVPVYAEWLENNFGDARGVEVLRVDEKGQRLGVRKGDLIIALNGERMGMTAEFFRASMALPPGSEVTFTLRRGTETSQVKGKLENRGHWPEPIGVREIIDVPDEWTLYQKAGHRGPWDDAVRKMLEECRRELGKRRPDQILQAGLVCAQAGCRDPMLMEVAERHGNVFNEEIWNAVIGWSDAPRLRAQYGGTSVWTRATLCSRFLQQGPVSARNMARREVEAAWAAVREDRDMRRRRIFANALATFHFLEGRYEACARLMKSVEEHYLRDMNRQEIQIHIQALCRLGRFDEAIAQVQIYKSADDDFYDRRLMALLAQTKDAVAGRRGPWTEEIAGPAGVLAWRPLAALDALHCASTGKPIHGTREADRIEEGYSKTYALPPEPSPDTLEVHLFARSVVAYARGAAKVGAVFGAQRKKDNADPFVQDYDVFAGAQYFVTPSALLLRRIGPNGPAPLMILPGFANDGTGGLRLFRTGDTVTLRSNGAWVTTDADPHLANQGSLLLHMAATFASADAGILVPTERCYDNDRIRSLLERVMDPKEKLTPEERLKLWDEASLLAPPANLMKAFRGRVHQKLRNAVPAPAYPADAPPLDPLTPDAAAGRFADRGPARWAAADPVEPDLVWCARPDGTIERMSRERYWTVVDPYIRDFSRREAVVKPAIFRKDAVWFATDRGLFHWDRKSRVFQRLVIGGVFHEVKIDSLNVQDGVLRAVTPVGTWTLDLERGTWRRE